MNKLGLMLILLLIPFASAISTDLQDVYQPGETVVIEITGNVLEPIFPDDVKIKRNNVEVPLEYDVKRFGENYFIWMIMPEIENNYRLIIEDLATTISGKVQRIDYNKNFSTSGNLTNYKVKPGFIITSKDFNLNVFLFDDNKLPIDIDFPVSGSHILKPGNNKLKFDIGGFEGSGFRVINVGKYAIPALFIGEPNEEYFLPSLRFYPKIIEARILPGEEIFPFTLIYSGEEPISEFVFDYNEDLFSITPEVINVSLVGLQEFNLSIREFPKEGIDEKIYARGENISLELEVKVDFTSDIGNVERPENGAEGVDYFCSELGGKFCTVDEQCSVELIDSRDGDICCIGTCIEKEKGKGLAIIGWLIGAIVLIVIVIIFAKYWKSKLNRKGGLKKRISDVEAKKI